MGPLSCHVNPCQMPGTFVVAGQILISLAFLEHFPPQAIAWLNTNTDKKASAVAELYLYELSQSRILVGCLEPLGRHANPDLLI